MVTFQQPPKYLQQPPKYLQQPPKYLQQPPKYLQQPPKQVDVVKVIFLFIGLGLSAYVTYAISKHLMTEISENLNSI